MCTYLTCLAFDPSGCFLAAGTSLGALVVLELPRGSVLRGEEERLVSEQRLWPSCRRAQAALAASHEAEDARYAESERARQALAASSEVARESTRALYRARQAQRDSRRQAREESRRLRLYVGSLPDPSYEPSGGKNQVGFLGSLHKTENSLALQAAITARGSDFLARLEGDNLERERKAKEREEKRLADEAAQLSAAAKLHALDLSPSVVKAKQSSFMQRLHRDLDKRKGFRETADNGKFYDTIGDARNANKGAHKAKPMPPMHSTQSPSRLPPI